MAGSVTIKINNGFEVYKVDGQGPWRARALVTFDPMVPYYTLFPDNMLQVDLGEIAELEQLESRLKAKTIEALRLQMQVREEEARSKTDTIGRLIDDLG